MELKSVTECLLGQNTFACISTPVSAVSYSPKLDDSEGMVWSLLARLQLLESRYESTGLTGLSQTVTGLTALPLESLAQSHSIANACRDRSIVREGSMHLPLLLDLLPFRDLQQAHVRSTSDNIPLRVKKARAWREHGLG